jgi:serine/threonine protein kinase
MWGTEYSWESVGVVHTQVRLAVHKAEGTKWAVKIIKKAQLDAEDMEGLQTEVDILRRLNHPNIIHLREASGSLRETCFC